MAGNSGRSIKRERIWETGSFLFKKERVVIVVKNIRLSGEEYLLYLRAHRDIVQKYFFGCFEKDGNEILTQEEIVDEMRRKIQIEIPMEPSCDDALKEIIIRLLDRYEVQGILMSVPGGMETGYQLLKNAG